MDSQRVGPYQSDQPQAQRRRAVREAWRSLEARLLRISPEWPYKQTNLPDDEEEILLFLQATKSVPVPSSPAPREHSSQCPNHNLNQADMMRPWNIHDLLLKWELGSRIHLGPTPQRVFAETKLVLHRPLMSLSEFEMYAREHSSVDISRFMSHLYPESDHFAPNDERTLFGALPPWGTSPQPYQPGKGNTMDRQKRTNDHQSESWKLAEEWFEEALLPRNSRDSTSESSDSVTEASLFSSVFDEDSIYASKLESSESLMSKSRSKEGLAFLGKLCKPKGQQRAYSPGMPVSQLSRPGFGRESAPSPEETQYRESFWGQRSSSEISATPMDSPHLPRAIRMRQELEHYLDRWLENGASTQRRAPSLQRSISHPGSPTSELPKTFDQAPRCLFPDLVERPSESIAPAQDFCGEDPQPESQASFGLRSPGSNSDALNPEKAALVAARCLMQHDEQILTVGIANDPALPSHECFESMFDTADRSGVPKALSRATSPHSCDEKKCARNLSEAMKCAKNFSDTNQCPQSGLFMKKQSPSISSISPEAKRYSNSNFTIPLSSPILEQQVDSLEIMITPPTPSKGEQASLKEPYDGSKLNPLVYRPYSSKILACKWPPPYYGPASFVMADGGFKDSSANSTPLMSLLAPSELNNQPSVSNHSTASPAWTSIPPPNGLERQPSMSSHSPNPQALTPLPIPGEEGAQLSMSSPSTEFQTQTSFTPPIKSECQPPRSSHSPASATFRNPSGKRCRHISKHLARIRKISQRLTWKRFNTTFDEWKSTQPDIVTDDVVDCRHFQRPSANSSKSSHSSALNKIFDQFRGVLYACCICSALTPYADDGVDPDQIGAEGTMSYLEALSVSLEETALLAVLTQVSAPTMGELTRHEFVSGWEACSADTLAKQRAQVARFRTQLTSDRDYFRRVYRHSFALGRATGQKAVALDTATEFWRMLFGDGGEVWRDGETDWLQLWIGFVQDRWRKSVGKDMWDQTLVFARKTMEDGSLDWWNEDSAWPSVVDEFVAHIKELRAREGTSDRMDIG